MSSDSVIVIRDVVDPRALFDAARLAVGNPPGWSLHDQPPSFTTVGMYLTDPEQEANAQVSVHFPVAGGLFPVEVDPEAYAGYPHGYAHAGFTVFGPDGSRRCHLQLMRKLAPWLEGLRWSWQFSNDDHWTHSEDYVYFGEKEKDRMTDEGDGNP